MKPIELHLNLPFSYWQEKDPRTGSACIRPEPSTFAVLLRCFYREMAGMKEDYEDCQVTAIRFLGGYLSLFDTEDLEKLFAVIHQCFSVKNACPASGVLFPGTLDMEMISEYQNRWISPLMFEIPSLSFRECEKLHLPVMMQALDKTVYFLQNFREDEWGLRIPIGIPGRTADAWHFLLGQFYHYSPRYLQFFSVDPHVQEDPAFYEICTDLRSHGYRDVCENTFACSESFPFLLKEPYEATEYISIGPGAVSRIDGFLVQNTSDLDFYFKKCTDYRSLVIHVEEISSISGITVRNTGL